MPQWNNENLLSNEGRDWLAARKLLGKEDADDPDSAESEDAGIQSK